MYKGRYGVIRQSYSRQNQNRKRKPTIIVIKRKTNLFPNSNVHKKPTLTFKAKSEHSIPTPIPITPPVPISPPPPSEKPPEDPIRQSANNLQIHFYSNTGFSVVELMIVIVIIGLLGSLSIPAYKDYLIRARVIELFTLLQPIRIAVSEQLSMGTPLSDIKTGSLGIEKLENKGVIKEITVANGTITAVGCPEKLGISVNKGFKLIIRPDNQDGLILWECKTEPEEYKKYAPANCRG